MITLGIAQAHYFEREKIGSILEHYFPSDLGVSQNLEKYMFLQCFWRGLIEMENNVLQCSEFFPI